MDLDGLDESMLHCSAKCEMSSIGGVLGMAAGGTIDFASPALAFDLG